MREKVSACLAAECEPAPGLSIGDPAEARQAMCRMETRAC